MMGKETEIAWCDATFNGWIGCDKVSLGCKNCYAEVDTPTRVHRANGLELWGAKAARYRTSAENWKKPRRWNREAAAAGGRRRVFAQSLSDTFEDRRDLDPWRADLFALIEETPHLDWLLLTKRPENMVRLAPASWAKEWPRNVWAGCTVENQDAADRRVPELLRVPADVRFLSVEPMLEAIDLRAMGVPHSATLSGRAISQKLDWIIVGGESGPGARPFDVSWVRSIVAQCRAAGVPVFVKQLGAQPVDDPLRWREWRAVGSSLVQAASADRHRVVLNDRKGGDMSEWPADLRVREWPEVSRG